MIGGWLRRWAEGLRFPRLLALTAGIFALDLFLPDLIPFVDEILLGLSTLLLAAWRRRRKSPADVSGEVPRIP